MRSTVRSGIKFYPRLYFSRGARAQKAVPAFGKNVIFSSCRGARSTRAAALTMSYNVAGPIFIPARVYLRAAPNKPDN